MTALSVVSIALVWKGTGLEPLNGRAVMFAAFATAAAIGIQAGVITNAANAPPVAAKLLVGVKVSDLVDPAKSLGPDDAPVTVVIFADFMCPACRAAHADLRRWQAENPNGVRLAYRHAPLWEISAAVAAVSEVAAESGKFWEFAEAAYRGFGRFDREGFRKAVEKLGMDFSVVESRVANVEDPALGRLRSDSSLAERFGIAATPAFIIVVAGHEPKSASLRGLQRALNEREVQDPLTARLNR
jgi:protein-disulfide isomerase